MKFGIEIRNKVTGRAVTLEDAQAVADFLAGLDKSEWEGYACLGELPEPTQLVKAESDASPIVDQSVNPVLGGEKPTEWAPHVDPILPSLTEALDAFHDGAETDPPKGADSIVLLEPVTLSVGDSGAGDSYLPADAAGEQA